MNAIRNRIVASAALSALLVAVWGSPSLAAPSSDNAPTITPAPVANAQPTAPATPATKPAVAAPVAPARNVVMKWTLADARALLAYIDGSVVAEGLIAADYKPAALKAAIAAGEGDALDAAASTSFTWLVEDLRDGRTPVKARLQWFALDKDMDLNPTAAVMTSALANHDIAGTLTALDPTYPDYKVLKDALATAEGAKRAQIQVNMDRWRWFSRDLGEAYLMTNVPEFQLRLVRRDKIVRTYRTIVGKPGKTATPQLAEVVEGVIFNPTWTVPQSIVVGEGYGKKYGSVAAAKAAGYAMSRSADGTITLVQQPGPRNSLGLMKLDMPNPHAIFLHDTPNRNLFNATFRALSHGCVRTDRATELAIAMAIIGGGKTADEAAEISASGKYTKVPMIKTMPVYIGYFTVAKDITGALSTFADIYGRDVPVLASFKAPRAAKTGQRVSNEKVIKLDNPL